MANIQQAPLDYAFVNFLKHEHLDSALRDKRWTEFARRYNGPEYAVNKYDEKLRKGHE